MIVYSFYSPDRIFAADAVPRPRTAIIRIGVNIGVILKALSDNLPGSLSMKRNSKNGGGAKTRKMTIGKDLLP